ncbi:hypothetical protein BW730_14745 [Tessaracoccus aquimaris]|uniref:CRISPR-associated helicase/endonuclease Cas3 n=1 Tax=Tessaracoccus aquimaris TaxID=1332264 RepID=A0A1Q2CR41_9ACTN|nr:CRISPR-associated helicase/endonuclease Cas3 [Tessaracoccus aquimaris]AQP48571.1 hypothetical protein BW730_14745 [Tessaracoccus aquimaris]
MADWSERATSCWGKLQGNETMHLPLVRHLQDAGDVMRALWAQQPRNVRRLFAESLGGEDAACAFVCFLASVHDLGKASQHFAFKAYPAGRPDVADAMRANGLDVPLHVDRPRGHALLGQAHLVDWLARRYAADPLKAQHLGGIVGGHHGSNPTDTELVDARIALRQEPPGWAEVRDEIMDVFATRSGAEAYLEQWLSKPIPVEVQVLTIGLVIMADWIASDEYLFPYGPPEADRAERALAKLNLPGAWSPVESAGDPDELLRSRFPRLGPTARLNAMQREMVRVAEEMETPGLLLLEAPMGSGKTEDALLAAEILAQRFGLGGVFVGLPTMATSNPMFARVKHWLDHVPSDGVTSVNLAHSKAGLNDEFAGLMPWARTAPAIYDDEVGTREAAATVHAWFLGRKKGMLANHVIGTIDQALFAGLKAKHVVLRHLGLATKVVIIDEVHAADSYMRTYLKRVLTWLGRYGTPVILMSATLPPSQREELLRAYADGRTGKVQLPTTDGYPVIHAVDDAGATAVGVELEGNDVHVALTTIDDGMDSLVTEVGQRIEDGGCVGVICNTVARAQEVFDVLSRRLDCEVVLLHSRFLAPHRAAREADLVRRLGPSGDKRPDQIVVVGTQVLEQSLDIDFDLMITDLAPVDLMLQRIGRLHRHDRSRPKGLERPECLIRGVDDWFTDPPEFPGGAERIYGRDSLLRSAAIVEDTSSVAIPRDIPTLVARAYQITPDVPEAWGAAAREATKVASCDQSSKVRRAGDFLLDDPRRKSNLNALINGPASDPDDSHGYRQVRDSEDSLEVIVVVDDGDGYRVPDDVGPYSGGSIGYSTPEGPLARALAACTLALPHSLSGMWIVDRVIDELEAAVDVSAWQASPWLKGQLALAVSPEGVGELAGRRIVYDLSHGLIVESEQKAIRQ